MKNIKLGSKLSFAEVNKFVENIASIVNDGEKSLYINMEFCQYLNSIMLSGLIRALKLCDKANCKMTLKKVNASVMTLFETTNVLSLFKIEDPEIKNDNQTSLGFSYKKISNNTGLFILKGSLSTSDQCSHFRGFYEKYILEIDNSIIDCSSLYHLGSPGVTELFRLRGMLQEKEGRLVIFSQTDSVESVWRMMHLESLVPKAETLEEAERILSK
jgi:anti-anti-sigma factor